MVINLDLVSFVTLSGDKVELNFKDGGSHMDRFRSVEEMVERLREWQDQTTRLQSTPLTDFPS